MPSLVEEFYNKYHSKTDGRFTSSSGGGAGSKLVRSSKFGFGKGTTKVEGGRAAAFKAGHQNKIIGNEKRSSNVGPMYGAYSKGPHKKEDGKITPLGLAKSGGEATKLGLAKPGDGKVTYAKSTIAGKPVAPLRYDKDGFIDHSRASANVVRANIRMKNAERFKNRKK